MPLRRYNAVATSFKKKTNFPLLKMSNLDELVSETSSNDTLSIISNEEEDIEEEEEEDSNDDFIVNDD